MARALVLRAPGINCDRETAYACRLAGFETDLVHINFLRKTPERLLDYAFFVIPGGFSYGDDLGAGTLLAKNLSVHLSKQLHQFIDEGRLLLGICNGFQVLVRAGLLPGHSTTDGGKLASLRAEGTDARSVPTPHDGRRRRDVSLPPSVPTAPTISDIPLCSLSDNASAQFECRWVTLSVEPGVCIFTQGIERCIQLPVAHGEGRFVLSEDAGKLTSLLARLQANGQIALVYAKSHDESGGHDESAPYGRHPAWGAGIPIHRGTSAGAISYPDNPNGSIGGIAGICNTQGNVFGLMPHPERYVNALQHPQRRGTVGAGVVGAELASARGVGELASAQGQGDGLLIFKNAYEYARKRERSPTMNRGGTMNRPPTVGTLPGGQVSRFIVGPGSNHISYAASGVDIATAEAAKKLMYEAVQATQGIEVMAGMGAFAGMLDARSIQKMHRPALVATTDGVGTKTLIAAQAGRFDTIGYDLVNHSVNDLLTQGATPLFFMDYLAMGKLDAMQAASIVQSVASACLEVGCALLGGETAEMPDVYLPGAFDLAGTMVGVVERDAIVDGSAIAPGDVLLGLPSSGLHTNGYSLARRVFAPYPLDTVFPELGEPLVDALLRPHRCYLREIQMLRARLENEAVGPRFIVGHSLKGIAHITGGGFAGNIVRILPAGMQAVVETGAWSVPPLFQLLAHLGQVTREEMYRTLNMGVGMVLVVSPHSAIHACQVLPELLPIGYITHGEGVIFR